MTRYLNLVTLFPFDRIPVGWLPCEGQSLAVAGNAGLYVLLGYRFGGSGNSFNLPDLRAQGPLAGVVYCIATAGEYPFRP